ncbi:MAG: glycosyltransferase, partial [Chamaesiphon sp. CSU_1_12]|nr:glycosyltransferase [Chamaesiphon sp. CSU_1_12]
DLTPRQAPELADARFSLFPNALGDTWRSLAPTQISIRRDGARRYLLAVARLDRHDRTKGIITTIEALGMLQEALHEIGPDIVGQFALIKDVGDDKRVGQAKQRLEETSSFQINQN